MVLLLRFANLGVVIHFIVIDACITEGALRLNLGEFCLLNRCCRANFQFLRATVGIGTFIVVLLLVNLCAVVAHERLAGETSERVLRNLFANSTQQSRVD